VGKGEGKKCSVPNIKQGNQQRQNVTNSESVRSLLPRNTEKQKNDNRREKSSPSLEKKRKKSPISKRRKNVGRAAPRTCEWQQGRRGRRRPEKGRIRGTSTLLSRETSTWRQRNSYDPEDEGDESLAFLGGEERSTKKLAARGRKKARPTHPSSGRLSVQEEDASPPLQSTIWKKGNPFYCGGGACMDGLRHKIENPREKGGVGKGGQFLTWHTEGGGGGPTLPPREKGSRNCAKGQNLQGSEKCVKKRFRTGEVIFRAGRTERRKTKTVFVSNRKWRTGMELLQEGRRKKKRKNSCYLGGKI